MKRVIHLQPLGERPPQRRPPRERVPVDPKPRHLRQPRARGRRQPSIKGEVTTSTSETADPRLDGLACAVCGCADGPMVPVGHGPHGQLFEHPACVELQRKLDEERQ